MPITHAIWTVGEKPISLKLDRLVSEKSLEDMIVEDSRILSDEWMLIGRQVRTFANRPLDLLAMAPDGATLTGLTSADGLALSGCAPRNR